MADPPASQCSVAEPICRGGKGMVLPLTELEAELPDTVRAALYAILMVYLFLGVAIVADTFMASIEAVTSSWRKVTLKSGKRVTQKVWNQTVATLTLMALGSSAPEIFLSVIDVVKNNFHSGDLGASTIVGSASFNLLVIVAVCVAVIPQDEYRAIKELPAFYITAFFSLFAYVWLVFILTMSSENVVDSWEAIATFLFLPLMVWISYKTDIGAFDVWMQALHLIPRPRIPSSNESPISPCSSTGISSEAGSAIISFIDEELTVEGNNEEQIVEVHVICAGMNTPASCRYYTSPYTGVPGCDYQSTEGQLEFAGGDDNNEGVIKIVINAQSKHKARSQFLLVLESIENASFDPDTDGGEDRAILTITIKSTRKLACWRRALGRCVDIDSMSRALGDWREQCTSAVYVNGSPEEQKEATKVDWCLHVLAFPWKLLFLMLPPPSFFGGWVCFVSSLVMLGSLTCVVSDLAELFGCVLGVGDIVTAVAFVALGTSMPDLFASLTAAREDPTADASIVNVTGSNSVNIFLGLGVPWTICAIYWSVAERTPEWEACYPIIAALYTGETAVFVVESRNLAFMVLMFTIACIVALFLLHWRRRWQGFELGGPRVPKAVTSTALLLFWIGWVCVVCWRVLREDAKAGPTEDYLVIGGLASFEFVVLVVAASVIYLYRSNRNCSGATESTTGLDCFEIDPPRSARSVRSVESSLPDPSREKVPEPTLV